MSKQIGTKQINVGGQIVSARVFAGKQSRNEDTLHAERLSDIRQQTTAEDLAEFMEMR